MEVLIALTWEEADKLQKGEPVTIELSPEAYSNGTKDHAAFAMDDALRYFSAYHSGYRSVICEYGACIVK